MEDRRGRLAGDLLPPLAPRRGRRAALRVLLGRDRVGGRQRAHRRENRSAFLRAVRELQETIKSRYRKSSPVRGVTYFVGPACARAGSALREEGRKGEPVRVYR